MRIPLLAVLAHHAAVIVRVLSQEALRVVVAVDVDLSQGVMGSRLLTALVDTSLQPWQEQLQSVSLLHLCHQFISGELPSHHQNEVLDDVLRAVHIQQPSNHYGQAAGIHLKPNNLVIVELAHTDRRLFVEKHKGLLY